jgi:uncharacterized protein YecE (DUF72 family)
VNAVRIGCSGWNYGDWRERFYPKGLGPKGWLRFYAEHFDTVEVNNTFYRLTKPAVVENWIAETPEEFRFAVKGSQYLTHMKRLQDRERGLERFYASIAPLAGHPKLGPVLWQLPPNFRRDVPRLEAWLECLPAGRHCVEFRDDSWFTDEVYATLYTHGAAFVIGDDPRRVDWPMELTADWTFIRFHYGTRGRRGNYSDTEIDEWAERIADLRERAEVWAYFNNDWEAFAIANAKRLKRLLALA